MRQRHGVLFGGILFALATGLVLQACATTPPTLRLDLPDTEVSLDAPLEVMALGAKIERASLQRIDAPSPAVELTRTDRGARFAGRLEPDAEYRVRASAEPDRATPLPWSSPSEKLSLERLFRTVHTPMLLDGEGPRWLTRGQPLTLHFSEPLAQVDVTGAAATARVAEHDRHLVEIEVANPQPGAELLIRLGEVRGVNNVISSEQPTVLVKVPDPARLVAVNGSSTSELSLPPETAVLLEWEAPVTAVRYRFGERRASWTGAATTDVTLPVSLALDETATLVIEDATTPAGGWLPEARSYALRGAAALQLAAFWPPAGATNLLPTSDPTFRFSEPVADRAAAEAAIIFEPGVEGRFEWLAPNRVRFLPNGGFERESEITMRVTGGPQGIRGESGGYLLEGHTSSFTTGKAKRIDVSLGRQVMNLYENDQVVWTAPVATGVRGADTPLGTYSVQYKMRQARFRGTNPNGVRYDIPDVNWVLAFLGDYTIHGAYWRSNFGTPGSNGCISLTDANARYVWLWADEGTPIVIRG